MEFEPRVAVISGAFWLVILIMIWKFQLTDAAWPLPQKIILTVCSAPIIYFAVNFQANR